MEPTIRAGDWLLVDPTTARWPRPGSIVAFREPDSDRISIKRVAATPGQRVPFRDGYLVLADDEAWLTADATPEIAAAAGFGEPIDSERFGPVPVAGLVGRVWLRYWPWRRIGRLAARPEVAHDTPETPGPSVAADGPRSDDPG